MLHAVNIITSCTEKEKLNIRPSTKAGLTKRTKLEVPGPLNLRGEEILLLREVNYL